MNKMSEKEKFKYGSVLQDNENYQDAIKVYNEVLTMERVSIKDIDILLQIADCYFNIKDFSKSLNYFIKAQNLAPSCEVVSLGIYLSFVELGKTKSAISELYDYSCKYSIDLYRDTIEELMVDISRGNATIFKDTIYKIGKRHDVFVKPASPLVPPAGTTSD